MSDETYNKNLFYPGILSSPSSRVLNVYLPDRHVHTWNVCICPEPEEGLDCWIGSVPERRPGLSNRLTRLCSYQSLRALPTNIVQNQLYSGAYRAKTNYCEILMLDQCYVSSKRRSYHQTFVI